MLFLNKEMLDVKRKLIMIALLIALIVLSTNIFVTVQAATGLSTTISGTANNVDKATGAVNRIWNSVKRVLQVVSVSIVLACGVRYMMASADQKADIKKSMTTLVIGAVITFAASTIIPYIVGVAKQLLVG